MHDYEDVFNKMNTEREKWETIRTNKYKEFGEKQEVMENCASCDQQNSDEHCIEHPRDFREDYYWEFCVND